MEDNKEVTHNNTEVSDNEGDENPIDKNLLTHLFNSVTERDIGAVQQALQPTTLKQRRALFAVYDQDGLGLIHLATAKEDLNMVRLLLEAGADINQITGPERNPDANPLNLAVQLENEDLINLLLGYQNNPAALIAHLAMAIKEFKIYPQCLIRFLNDPSVNQQFKRAIVQATDDEYAPLDEAVRKQDVALIRELLAIPLIKAGINGRGKSGVTALHWAAYMGNREIFGILRENKASHLQLGKKDGESILHYAVFKGDDNRGFIQELLAFKGFSEILLNAPDRNGKTPLQYASHNQQLGLVDELSNQGAILTLDDNGGSALHIACAKSNLDIVNLLLERYPDVCSDFLRATSQETPYWDAVLAERVDEPNADVVAVQERLVGFIHERNDEDGVLVRALFIDGLFTGALSKINKIPDENLRRSMSGMYQVLRRDYVREIITTDPVQRANIITQNNKVLCLTQLLGTSADRILNADGSMQEIADHFKSNCESKLYNERSRRFALQVIGGIIGGLVFGIGGFIAGAAATSGPGGPILGGIAAAEGVAIGAAAACAASAALVGAAGGVAVASLFVRTIKLQYSIWKVNQACNKQVRLEVARQREEVPEDQQDLLHAERMQAVR